MDNRIKAYEHEIRNKTIDEFAEQITNKSSDILVWLMERQSNGYGTSSGELHEKWILEMKKIAEQMKGGGTA